MRHLLRFLAAVALTAAALQPVHAQVDPNPNEAPITLQDGSQLWFVEFSSLPVADGGSLVDVLAEQSAFRAGAGQAGVRYTERKAFQNLWNGLSVAVNPRDLPRLRSIAGVDALYPVVEFTVPELEAVNEPELITALAMTGADIAQNSLGLSGAGIKVGVIDTGVDYDHPALGGDGTIRNNSAMFPNARVIAGWDFVGDAFANSASTPVPDAFPDDCGGHGSHVAGIIGANGTVLGVAPNVSIGAYRVFGCSGTTSADIMIDAMERALDDGMQVVNMSIGAAFQWPQYPTATASNRLVNKGVVVVASIGNSGTSGLWAASAPGVGLKVIGVAAFMNTFVNQAAITVSPDNKALGYSPGSGTPAPPPPPDAGSFPVARVGTQLSTNAGCSVLPAGSLAGSVALIRRGACSFYIKAINAQNAGALGVLLYNNVAGALTPNVTPPVGQPPVTIPVVMLSQVDGNLLDSRLALGAVTMTWGGLVSAPNATGGQIAGFSSFGPGADLTIKPDIGAPGGFILSTVPLEQGGYAQNSGTSMSSPHVAGAVALLLEARPNTPSNAVRDILMNSATPGPRGTGINSVHSQGAGMLRIDDAVQATTRIEPGKLELGESAAGPQMRTISIENDGPAAVSYTLTHQNALATGPNTFSVSFLTHSAGVAFSVNPVVVPAGAKMNVNVTITADPALPDRCVYGGYLVAIPDNGAPDLRIPFAGITGDYQAIQVLVPTPNNFPWLAKLVGTSFFNQPTGASYTMQGNDIPFFLLHLDHPSAKLRMEVVDAVTGESHHLAANDRYLPRNSAATSFFAFSWGGGTFHGQQTDVVPNGQYVMRVSILKALGDDNNPAHWEVWTSPAITVARPDLVVQGLWLSENLVELEQDVTAFAGLRNDGAEAAAGVTVSFFDNDELFHTEVVDFAGQESRVVQAPWHVSGPAQHRLRVEVSRLDDEVSFANNLGELGVTIGETIVGVGDAAATLELAPAAPNPSQGDVAFRFRLPAPGGASLDVFDLAGRRLQGWSWSRLPAGEHSVRWDGKTIGGGWAPAGAVLLRLTAAGSTLTRKAVRLP